MTKEHISSNNLKIKNPNSFLGLIYISYATGILILLSMFVPEQINHLKNIINILSKRNHISEILILILVYSGIFWIIAIQCAFDCLKYYINGLRLILIHYVPPGVPKNIQDKSALERLLMDRTIIAFENPSGLMLRALRFFSDRFKHLTRMPAAHVEETFATMIAWAWLLPLLVAPTFVLPLLKDAVRIPFAWPIPYMLIVVVFAGMTIRILAMYNLTSIKPSAAIYEDTINITNSGNPNTFYSFTKKSLGNWREGTFQNREYDSNAPNCGLIDPDTSNRCVANILMETQPMPINKSAGNAHVLLGIGGLCLGLFGLFLLFSMASAGIVQTNINHHIYNGPSLLLSLLAALVAISIGRKCVFRAYLISNRYLFTSNIIRIILEIDYTASRIGYGDGRGGQIYSNKVRIQSHTFLKVFSANIISESEGLLGWRVIISSSIPDRLRKRVKDLIGDIQEYKDTGGELPDVDIGSESFNNMRKANYSIVSDTAVAQEGGRLYAQQAMKSKQIKDSSLFQDQLEEFPSDINGASDNPTLRPDERECPFCAEIIKARAKICRFCKNSLEDFPPEQNN